MQDLLSISDLLKQLDKKNVEMGVYDQCMIAERLCRQHDFRQSIRIAREAVTNAVQIDTLRKASTTGVAFLFLAFARHASNIKAEYEAALWDADAAVKWLITDRHNGLIARLIKARIAQEHNRRLIATQSYIEAGLILEALIKECFKRGKKNDEFRYIQLRSAVGEATKKLSVTSSEGQPPVADWPARTEAQVFLPNPDEHGDPYLKLLSQINLIWPGEKIPVLQIAGETADIVSGILINQDQPLKKPVNFSKIKYLSIESRRYIIKAIDTKNRLAFRMYAGELYFSIRIAENPPAEQANLAYLIVRRQRQFVSSKPFVVSNPKVGRIWIENMEPFIIGGSGDVPSPRSAAPVHSEQSRQMIGTVEALLFDEKC